MDKMMQALRGFKITLYTHNNNNETIIEKRVNCHMNYQFMEHFNEKKKVGNENR